MSATRARADDISQTRVRVDFDRSTHGFHSHHVSPTFRQCQCEKRQTIVGRIEGRRGHEK